MEERRWMVTAGSPPSKAKKIHKERRGIKKKTYWVGRSDLYLQKGRKRERENNKTKREKL